MPTNHWTLCAVLCFFASATDAFAQGAPATPSAPPTMRWQLPPLVDGARRIVVPAMPRKPASTSVWQRAPEVAQAPVEYFIRVFVPDTARLSPMPVIRPAVKP